MFADFPIKPIQKGQFKTFNKIMMVINRLPKESTMKSESQIKYIISELQNSTTGKQNQVINNIVVLHKITGVCWINIDEKN